MNAATLLVKKVAYKASLHSQPTSCANGRYKIKKFLREGSKKKVYPAHDSVLDRDVAFALIKTEKLAAAARIRFRPIAFSPCA